MHNNHNKLQLKIFTTLTLFAIATSAYAISAADLPITSQIPDLEEQVEVNVEPKYPGPGEQVKITLEAYGTDLNRASISWSVDGKETLVGKGQRALMVTAGKLGENKVVVAKILPVNGLPITKTLNINAQSVDIVWESDTYTPPFYRGKAMFTPQENVKLVAMPNLISTAGVQVSPSAVTYKWKRDYEVLGDESGYGAQTINYKGDLLMLGTNIGMEASIEGGGTAASYIDLDPTSPEIFLYENSPIYGILWNKEISRGLDFGATPEKGVTAIPYFFGVPSRVNTTLTYSWYINGTKIAVPKTQNEMTFRNSEDLEGLSQINVGVNNSKNLLQQSSGGTVINFKKPGKASLL